MNLVSKFKLLGEVLKGRFLFRRDFPEKAFRRSSSCDGFAWRFSREASMCQTFVRRALTQSWHDWPGWLSTSPHGNSSVEEFLWDATEDSPMGRIVITNDPQETEDVCEDQCRQTPLYLSQCFLPVLRQTFQTNGRRSRQPEDTSLLGEALLWCWQRNERIKKIIRGCMYT